MVKANHISISTLPLVSQKPIHGSIESSWLLVMISSHSLTFQSYHAKFYMGQEKIIKVMKVYNRKQFIDTYLFKGMGFIIQISSLCVLALFP